MPLMPFNATTKKIAWSDFEKVDKSAPGEDEIVTAAHTAVTFDISLLGTIPVPNSKPQTYRISDAVFTLKMPKGKGKDESWVAKFVFKRSQTDQDTLLKHEQGHYMLSALYARDYTNAVQAGTKKTYTDKKDADAALKAITDKFSPPRPAASPLGALHDAYDDQVTDLFADSATQKKWDKAIESAGKNNTPIKDALSSAGLI